MANDVNERRKIFSAFVVLFLIAVVGIGAAAITAYALRTAMENAMTGLGD